MFYDIVSNMPDRATDMLYEMDSEVYPSINGQVQKEDYPETHSKLS